MKVLKFAGGSSDFFVNLCLPLFRSCLEDASILIRNFCFVSSISRSILGLLFIIFILLLRLLEYLVAFFSNVSICS